jgi:hypothetical protein
MRWVCALMLSGCSFIGVHVPASGPFERPNQCETSLPDLDAVVASSAVLFAAVSLAVAVAPDTRNRGFGFPNAAFLVFVPPALATAALTGSSALYGFHRVHACRAHVDDLVARMEVEALAAARAGRCDEVVEARTRLERLGRDLDLRDPSTKACFPYYCASDEAGFCACSHAERDCEPAVETGLAPACVPERVDICTAAPAARAR